MKVEAPFIHLIKLHTKYYLYDVNSKMIVNISAYSAKKEHSLRLSGALFR